YVVERAHDAGKLTDAEFADYRGAHGWEAFERRIFVKEQVVGALDADLKRVPLGECIVIGTATDPYQPAERKFRVTRAVLRRLAQRVRASCTPALYACTPRCATASCRSSASIFLSWCRSTSARMHGRQGHRGSMRERCRAASRSCGANMDSGITPECSTAIDRPRCRCRVSSSCGAACPNCATRGGTPASARTLASSPRGNSRARTRN